MRGTNHLLAVTTTTDEVTGEIKPLFAFPVQICKGVQDNDVKFDIAAPSGAARKQAFTDEATGELITDADCKRGIRIGDEFKPIPQEQIDKINEATKLTTMVALGNIPIADIPWDRTTGRYFVQSPVKGGTPKFYKLAYEALLAEGIGIVSKRTASSRQKMVVIYPDATEGCLMLVEMAFASDVREPDAQVLAPQQAVIEQKQLDVARKVFQNLGDGLAALNTEEDDAIALKRDLIEQAVNGETLNIPTPIAESVATDDLTALLEASLAG